jgi:type I restriction enzyme S subunit
VDSDLGPIPDSWGVRRLSEITSHVNRGIAPRYAEHGAWIVLNQRCIRAERVSFGPARRQERPVADAKRVRFGDVLINSTGVGTLGRVAQFREAVDFVTADSHVTVVRPETSELRDWLGLALQARQAELAALGTGSTGQTDRQSVEGVRFAVPNVDTSVAFSRIARPLLDAVPQLARYNERLATTRNLLLPRLVTGRLDISDVELGDLLPPEDE